MNGVCMEPSLATGNLDILYATQTKSQFSNLGKVGPKGFLLHFFLVVTYNKATKIMVLVSNGVSLYCISAVSN